MDIKAWNRRKNLYLRKFKMRIGKFLFDHKNQQPFTHGQTIKKVLYLRNDDKLGDMIISTVSFRELKTRLPAVQIDVIAGPNAQSIIKNNPNVSDIYIYHRKWAAIIKLGRLLRAQKYDLYVDMDDAPTIESLLLLWLIKPKFALGFNRQNFKLYDINIPFDLTGAHITARHEAIFKVLGLLGAQPFNTKYDLYPSPSAQAAASAYLTKLPLAQSGKNIILNPFAAVRRKNFMFEQMSKLAISLPQHNFILVGAPPQLADFTQKQNLPQNLYCPMPEAIEQNGFDFTLALISQSALVVTPDTAIVHAAAAFNKPLVAVYLGSKNNNLLKVWGPLNSNAKTHLWNGDFKTFDIRTLKQYILSITT